MLSRGSHFCFCIHGDGREAGDVHIILRLAVLHIFIADPKIIFILQVIAVFTMTVVM